MKTKADVEVFGGGSVYGVQPLTQAARDWIAENVTGETTWYAGALMVGHRYVSDLLDGMQAAGLELAQ